MNMDTDIYRSQTNRDIFVAVLKGTSSSSLPQNVQNQLGNVTLFKSITIKNGEIRAGINSDQAIAEINEKGYYVFQAEVK